MHSRTLEIDGEKRVLEFGHEGVLYKSAFVMYDKYTNSKWNHATGQALAGPLAGRRLDILPARLVRWSEWKREHPSGRVLLGTRREGFMGRFDGRSQPGEIGISTGRGPRSTLYPYDVLLERGVVNDTVLRRPVVVTMDPETRETSVFSRRLQDRTLTFRPLESEDDSGATMRDDQTGSLWDRSTGEALEGPLEGRRLEREIAVTWRIDRWRDIYPEGERYE